MGWAEGLQSGMALGNLINQGLDRRELSEESKKYTVGQGAYGEDVRGNLENLQAARESNIAAMQAQGYTPDQIATANKAYDQAQAELTRRVGLTAPDYYVTGDTSGKTYGSMQEAQQALAPLRTHGLAEVYRSHGDVEKASELEARSQQQQLTGLQLKGAERAEKLAVGNQLANDEISAMKADGKSLTTQDIAAISKRHGADYNTLLDGELKQLGYDKASADAEIKALTTSLSKAALKGVDGVNKFLAEKFDPDKTDNISPEIVKTKSGFVVKYGNQILPDYGSHESLDSLISSVHGRITGDYLGTLKTMTAIEASRASTAASKSAAGMYSERTTDMRDARTNRNKAADIAAEFDTLTDAEKVGPRGRGLITQFNMANAKAGGQVSLGGLSSKNTDDKPLKVEDEGEKKTIGGKLVVADGNGNWIPADGNGRPVGVLPSERQKFLKQNNVPDNLIGQLPWSKDGKSILFNGKAYDVKDPKDLKTMVDTYKRLGKADIAMQEGLAADLALQERTRRRAGLQPSIYAPEDDWRLYRNQERNMGLIPPID